MTGELQCDNLSTPGDLKQAGPSPVTGERGYCRHRGARYLAMTFTVCVRAASDFGN